MHSLVVIQWNRLGDLLQTRVLLQRLQQHNNGDKIVLCCDSRYASLAGKFPEEDEVWPIDLAGFSSLARHRDTHKDFIQAFREFRDANASDVKTVYVLTRSLTAATFANLLQPKQIVGYSRKDNTLLIPPVLQQIEESVEGGFRYPVHLADVWAGFANVDGTPDWLTSLEPSEQNHEESKRHVALICDAGEIHRRIPAEWQVHLVREFLIANVVCSLIGYSAEQDELSQIASENPTRIHDYRGKTNLEDLTTLLPSHEIVLGSDSGGLHLSASLGLPVIGLYFGGADCRQTGPYSKSACVFQDPAWNSETMHSIVDIVQHTVNSNSSSGFNCKNTDHVFYPALDHFGILYSNMIPDQTSQKTLLEERTNILNHDSSDNAAKSGVSIIIPEHGGRHYTHELLADLKSELNGLRFEILLISSGSEGQELLTSLDNVRQFNHDQTLTFAEACNLGASKAAYPWLLFLNNDTRISNGNLKKFLASGKERLISSPLIIYPDGLIQNAGVRITDDCIEEVGHGETNTSELNCSLQAVSGVAMLLTKANYLALNGFDENYKNGYEDLDLCLRASVLGIECCVTEEAQIIHYRGSTEGRFKDENTNRKRFFSRVRPFSQPNSESYCHPSRKKCMLAADYFG